MPSKLMGTQKLRCMFVALVSLVSVKLVVAEANAM